MGKSKVWEKVSFQILPIIGETVFQSFGTPLALKRKSSLGADQMQRSSMFTKTLNSIDLGKRELMGGHYLANADFRINQPKIKSDEHETDKLSHTSSHDSEYGWLNWLFLRSTHKPASADVNKEGQIRIISSYCDNCFDRISDFQDELGRRMTCDINWEFIGKSASPKILHLYRFLRCVNIPSESYTDL